MTVACYRLSFLAGNVLTTDSTNPRSPEAAMSHESRKHLFDTILRAVPAGRRRGSKPRYVIGLEGDIRCGSKAGRLRCRRMVSRSPRGAVGHSRRNGLPSVWR